MSDLSQLKSGQISLDDFLAREVGRIRAALGKPVTADLARGAADQIETVKASVQGAVDAFLSGKGIVGAVAEQLADGLINGLAAAVESAARAAVEGAD